MRRFNPAVLLIEKVAMGINQEQAAEVLSYLRGQGLVEALHMPHAERKNLVVEGINPFLQLHRIELGSQYLLDVGRQVTLAERCLRRGEVQGKVTE